MARKCALQSMKDAARYDHFPEQHVQTQSGKHGTECLYDYKRPNPLRLKWILTLSNVVVNISFMSIPGRLTGETSKEFQGSRALTSRLRRLGGTVPCRSVSAGAGQNQHAKEPYENNQCQWRAYEVQYHNKSLHSGDVMACSHLIFCLPH